MASGIQKQLDDGAVPAFVSNVCPKGTQMWVLEVGWLEADEGFVLRGGNTSLNSTKPRVDAQRKILIMSCSVSLRIPVIMNKYFELGTISWHFCKYNTYLCAFLYFLKSPLLSVIS